MFKRGSRHTPDNALPVTIADYLKHLKRLNRSDKTLTSTKHCLGVLQAWLESAGFELTATREEELEAFQIYLTREYTHHGKSLSPGTVRNYLGIIKVYYRYLLRERLLLSSPAENLLSPKSAKRIHRDILTNEELSRFLAAPDTETAIGLRDAVALRLMALSGLRCGDIIRLNVEDIDLREREIIIRQGKGKRDRLCFFDTVTRTFLSRYLLQARAKLDTSGKSIAVFLRENGERVNADVISWLVGRNAKQAGIKRHITPHSLRRTFCTILLRAGCNMKVIAELAGHKRLTTTARYTKVNIEELTAVYKCSHPRSRYQPDGGTA